MRYTVTTEEGREIAYDADAPPGERCSTCQGLWGTTYHPADRPCSITPPGFYAHSKGGLRPRSMMWFYGP